MNEPTKRITDGSPEESGAASQPLRKPKHSVWLSLVVATAANLGVQILEQFIFFGVSLLYLITFKPYRSGEEHWLIPDLVMGAIALWISVLVYRRFRWGKAAAPREGEGGDASVTDDMKHSGVKNGGLTSIAPAASQAEKPAGE